MMKILKLIAILSITTGATAVFAHNNSAHSSAPVEKVQTAWGIAGDAKAVNRTITVTMTDQMRFIPAELQIRAGDTVKLVVRNAGKGLHELVIGTKAKAEVGTYSDVDLQVHIADGQARFTYRDGTNWLGPR